VVGRHRPGEEVSAVGSGTPGEKRWRSDERRRTSETTDVTAGVRGGRGRDRATGVGQDEGCAYGSHGRDGALEDHVWFEDRWMVASSCDE
jgi:hypothetical protein